MKWFLQKTNPEFVGYLSGAARISPVIAQILINRGIRTPEEAESFLRGIDGPLDDPFCIEGIKAAVQTILQARASGVRIMVHGDYDVDGLTATAIMTDGLRRAGLDTVYFVPNRFTDGYGLNTRAIGIAKDFGAGIIVTVDCGITSFEAAHMAKEYGIGLIITDHHEPATGQNGKFVMPEALCVVNPKLQGGPASRLSGAGIALKFIQALNLATGMDDQHEEYYDLAMLGTLADSVPVIGENRVIVRKGLMQLNERGRAGLRALISLSGINGREIKPGLMSFTLVPRLNAAGRMSDASVVVELFLTDDTSKAEELASSLNKKNTERQKIEEQVFMDALRQLENKGVLPVVVLYGEGWHEGVIGIVASKIADRTGRPTVILSITDDMARGSARSIPGFDMHNALQRMSGMLIAFGGHTQAAGVRIKKENILEFERGLVALMEDGNGDLSPTLNIDASVGLSDVNQRLIEELRMLEPFGCGNPEPVLGAKNLRPVYPRVVGKNHLKMKLQHRNSVLEAIGFGMGGLMDMIEDESEVDAAFTACVNEYEGKRIIQLNIKALRPCTDSKNGS